MNVPGTLEKPGSSMASPLTALVISKLPFGSWTMFHCWLRLPESWDWSTYALAAVEEPGSSSTFPL